MKEKEKKLKEKRDGNLSWVKYVIGVGGCFYGGGIYTHIYASVHGVKEGRARVEGVKTVAQVRE